MRHTDRLRPGRVPLHAFAGAILVLAGEALIIAHHRPVSDYYFPFAWFGYTLVLDGALKTQTGTSLWSDRRGLFAALLCPRSASGGCSSFSMLPFGTGCTSALNRTAA